MKIVRYSPLVLIAASMVFAACNDTLSSVPKLATDAIISADVAASSGDAIATTIADMILNEGGGIALPMIATVPGAPANDVASTLDYVRTRTCFDPAGAVLANCLPIASVRKIAVHVTANGSRSGSRTTAGGATGTFTGAVHRTADDTLTRVFSSAQPPVETSRIHSGVSVARDTTTFTEGVYSRVQSEAANDTVKALTWNLPRSTNPWPVSGRVVRAANVHVVATNGTRTETRDVTRRVEVIFPADAQGNVVLKVNEKTCNLNLATHAVTNCQ